jgi:predicted ATPase/class 3 adenylate cyclase
LGGTTSTDIGTHAAVVFTDLVDSTRVHEEVGDAAARGFWVEHERVARELLRARRGREVGRSDGFLILFDRCDDALAFAFAYHSWLRERQPPWRARAGVHWGPVVLRRNGAVDRAAGATPFEVDGMAVPVAARIMSAAQGGQTLLSVDVRRALAPEASGDREIRSLGHWRLKSLAEPVELFEAAPAAGDGPPIPETAKAYRVIQRAGQWVPLAALPNNLGPEPDTFVGRDVVLRAIAGKYDAGARLVTLLGPGGVGKTRVAQRYARGWLGDFPGGAWFCDLSSARGVDGIAHVLAQVFDVPLGGADPIQQLAVAIGARGPCLIVLDNFEQVARDAAATLGAWLVATPEARFLVTSRELLGLRGERVEELQPLPSADAQGLFIQRVRAAGLRDRLDIADAAALPTLVELLDGLPLAIELAAARARVIAPAELVVRMRERFLVLASRGPRPDRQATLRATLDWSWDLLDAAERSALAQLSVFEGGFTLEAAEAVVDVVRIAPSIMVADVVQSLIEKSLVRRLHARRFALLQTVRDYAAEKLPGVVFRPAISRALDRAIARSL